MNNNFLYKDANRISSAVRKGEVSAREITEAFLQRATTLNDKYNCFSQFLSNRALKEADKVDEIIDEREKLIKSLGQIKSVKVYPSKANFLLCKLDNHNLQFVNNGLLSEGVFVRLFATKGLEKCFRVSIGSPDDNQYFYTKLQKVLKSE